MTKADKVSPTGFIGESFFLPVFLKTAQAQTFWGEMRRRESKVQGFQRNLYCVNIS